MLDFFLKRKHSLLDVLVYGVLCTLAGQDKIGPLWFFILVLLFSLISASLENWYENKRPS